MLDTGYGGRKTVGSGPTHPPGHSSGHTNPPNGSTYYLRKTKLSFTTTPAVRSNKNIFCQNFNILKIK